MQLLGNSSQKQINLRKRVKKHVLSIILELFTALNFTH